jgi:hypothetical protein
MQEPSLSLLARLTPPHDLTDLARAEGFLCASEIPARQWLALSAEGTPAARLRRVFELLRRRLAASIGRPGPDRMRGILVHGKTAAPALPAELREFARRVAAGERGVSDDGLAAALDLPRAGGGTSLVFVTVTARGFGKERRLVLEVEIDPDLAWAERRARVA